MRMMRTKIQQLNREIDRLADRINREQDDRRYQQLADEYDRLVAERNQLRGEGK